MEFTEREKELIKSLETLEKAARDLIHCPAIQFFEHLHALIDEQTTAHLTLETILKDKENDEVHHG